MRDQFLCHPISRRSAPLWRILLLAFLLVPVSAQRGRIEQAQITSGSLTNNLFGDKATRPFKVYLPPSYDTSVQEYPVVYVLHGYTQDENALLSSMQASLDSLIRQRKVGEMIAVFVNGANRLSGSFYLSSPVIGDYETYIVKDLVALVDSRYRTLASRDNRAITGFSMGGWGTMHLSFKFPDIFSVAVAESGLYDARGKLNDGLAKQFASAHPANLSQFASVPFPVNSIAALFAGLAPNPQRTSLFADYPYERVNGQTVLIDSVHQLALAGDVQHGDLARYAAQPLRLNGIRIIHGTSDPIVPILEARQFTNALALAGVPFEYQEHSGGHEYHADLALPFLSAHLPGAALYLAPPLLSIRVVTDSLLLEFPTLTGVAYDLESSADAASWTVKTNVSGSGQPAVLNPSLIMNREFFRIHARNEGE